MSKSNRKKAEELNIQGNHFLKEKNFIEAKSLYEKAILSDPEFSSPYYNMGIVFSINNDEENALKYFIKTIELNPKNIDAYIGIGKIYSDRGEYKSAIKHFNRALQLNTNKYGEKHPQTLKIFNIIGRMYSRIKPVIKDYNSYISSQIKMIKNLFANKGYVIFDYKSNRFYELLIIAQEMEITFCYIFRGKENIIALDDIESVKRPLWVIDGQNSPSLVYQAYQDIIIIKSLLEELLPVKQSIRVKSLIIILNGNIKNADEIKETWDNYRINITRLPHAGPDSIQLFSEYIEKKTTVQTSQNFKEFIIDLTHQLDHMDEEDRQKRIDQAIGNIDPKSLSKKDKKAEDPSRPQEEVNLKKFGTNLNDEAVKGNLPPCIGREKEINTIYEILFREYKNNPLLLGNSGVGKTVIIEEIANRIVRGDVPDFLKDKQIIEISAGELISGTTLRGQLELRIVNLLKALKKNRDVILFIDEIHTLMDAGESSSADSAAISQMLKPALSRNEITLIGATTYDDYRKYVQNDKAFERRFYPIKIEEMSEGATRKVINSIKSRLETHYGVNITDDIVDLIIELAKKYIKKRHFPDKAIDILEKVISSISIKGESDITPKHVKAIVEEYVGIQYLDTDTESFKRLLGLEDYLSSQVFGQDDAIGKVSDQIRLTKRKLDLKPERPDGVFLFTGPTGVGKTELAKALCHFLYGNDDKLLKLDMTEFNDAGTVAKLLGAPPGYHGYMEYPFLTKYIEENPSCVLLLDEIEKAHDEVIKLFMQVIDEGRLRDSRGKTVYFSDVTVIMTTNAFQGFKAGVGFGNKDEKEKSASLFKELLNFFPIEFLNRIDDIIVFNRLDRKYLKQIVEKKLFSRIKSRFEKENLIVNIDKDVMNLIIKKGYDDKFGARNMERVFEKMVISELSNFLYKNSIKRLTNIRLSINNGQIVISKKPRNKPSSDASSTTA